MRSWQNGIDHVESSAEQLLPSKPVSMPCTWPFVSLIGFWPNILCSSHLIRSGIVAGRQRVGGIMNPGISKLTKLQAEG